MHIDEIRKMTIKFHELNNMDNKYYFYYDETNNIRKFRLNGNNGFNISIEDVVKNFVLGGVVLKDKTSKVDINILKSDLSLDKSIKEIKFKHIAHGSFSDCLTSKKLNIFLHWIIQQPVHIHYSTLDILYWSIVDIIDSAIDNVENINTKKIAILQINELKAIFFEIVKFSLNDVMFKLNLYGYPVIKRENTDDFLIFMLDVVNNGKNSIDDKYLNSSSLIPLLISILEESKGKELSFLESNEDLNYLLINNFAEFYRHRTWLFVNSVHVFDNEKQIELLLKNNRQYYNKNAIENYSFSDSKSEELIQVSDIIVGILGKYFEYINQIDSRNIEQEVLAFTTIQKENLFLLLKLCKDAEHYNKAYIHYTTSVVNIRKDTLISELSEN
ncbi:hypothetical protein C9926_01325 [Sulfurovum lithotrophicum]|nr:hypothetical protein C9926_01325 [Sulfurovum lithotrophicum]